MVKYEFVTGEIVEIEVGEEVEEVIMELERMEYRRNRSETRRHQSIMRMEEYGFQFEDKAIDIEMDFESRELLEILQAAMEGLLPEQRELVRKVYFEGKSFREIASDGGDCKSTSQYRISKILKELKKYFL